MTTFLSLAPDSTLALDHDEADWLESLYQSVTRSDENLNSTATEVRQGW